MAKLIIYMYFITSLGQRFCFHMFSLKTDFSTWDFNPDTLGWQVPKGTCVQTGGKKPWEAISLTHISTALHCICMDNIYMYKKKKRGEEKTLSFNTLLYKKLQLIEK